MRGFRTDLAMECIDESGGKLDGVTVRTRQFDGMTHTRIRIEKERAAEILGRRKGEYITVECADLTRCDAHRRDRLAALIAEGVQGMLPPDGEVLVV